MRSCELSWVEMSVELVNRLNDQANSCALSLFFFTTENFHRTILSLLARVYCAVRQSEIGRGWLSRESEKGEKWDDLSSAVDVHICINIFMRDAVAAREIAIEKRKTFMHDRQKTRNDCPSNSSSLLFASLSLSSWYSIYVETGKGTDLKKKLTANVSGNLEMKKNLDNIYP